MSVHDALWQLESRFWEASAAGDADAYRELLLDEALLVFPGPTGALDKQACVDAIGGSPARSLEYRLEDRREIALGADTVLLTYRGVALWEGADREAHDRRGSVFVRRNGAWKLAFHQVTPIA